MDRFDYSEWIQKTPSIYSFTLYTPTLNEALDKEEFLRITVEDHIKLNTFAHSVPKEMSDMNLSKVREFFGRLVSPRLVVEIGVMRNPGIQNTTQTVLEMKPDTCAYVGIDIEDRSYVKNYGTNIYTLQIDSADTSTIKEYLSRFNTPIDYLFIDGLHSIYQVGKEIDLISLVRKGGVIGFHDISVHTGPNAWMDAFDPDKFEIYKFHAEGDWGIGFLVVK
jgi:hypothetical protein